MLSIYYQINSNERVLLSIPENGKKELTHDLHETTTKINDRVTLVRYVESTPYHEILEGYKIEVLKSERTCEFAVL